MTTKPYYVHRCGFYFDRFDDILAECEFLSLAQTKQGHVKLKWQCIHCKKTITATMKPRTQTVADSTFERTRLQISFS